MSTSRQSPKPSPAEHSSRVVARLWHFGKNQNLLGKILLIAIPVCGVCFLCSILIAVILFARTSSTSQIAQNSTSTRKSNANEPREAISPTIPIIETETPLRASSTPTAQVTALPTPPTATILEGTVNTNANVRELPSTSGKLITTLKQGEQVSILGRNQQEDWLRIQQGWIFAELVDVQGDKAVLPIAEVNPSSPDSSPTLAETEDAIAALNRHLQNTVCSAPIPAWCESIKGVGTSSETLSIRTSLSASERQSLEEMLQGLSSFVYNNLYKDFGITAIEIYSDVDGSLIARRKGLEDAFEFFEPSLSLPTEPTSVTIPTPVLEPTLVPSTVPAPVFSFGEGMQAINTNVPAGTYRALGGNGCYWERLSGFAGTLGEIVANENANGPTIVTIAETDRGFNSGRCSTWTQALSPITASPTAMNDNSLQTAGFKSSIAM